MLLALHIVVALTSLVVAGAAFFFPSQRKLQVSYGLIALTLISGTYLVWSLHTNILSVCATGLAYLAIVSVAIIAAKHKLQTIPVLSE